MQELSGSDRRKWTGFRAARFMRLAGGARTAELLQGCPVVTGEGVRIGIVDHVLVDAVTQQLCYVVLTRRRRSAVVVIPWHALYFDSAGAQLVYYAFV